MKWVQIAVVLLAAWIAPVSAGTKPRYLQPRHRTSGTPLTNDDLNYLLQSSLADYSKYANNFQLYTGALFPEHVAVPSVDTSNTVRTRRSIQNAMVRRLIEELARIQQERNQNQQMPGTLMKESAMRYLTQAGDHRKGA